MKATCWLWPICMALVLAQFPGCVDYNRPDPDAGEQDGLDGAEPGDGDPGPGDQDERPDQDPFDAGDPGRDGPGDPGLDGADSSGDTGPPVCGPWISALADCPYQLAQSARPGACLEHRCLDRPCSADRDCPAGGGGEEAAGRCVTGSCAFCWQDSQCPRSLLCRGGHCIASRPTGCGYTPTCTTPGCRLITPSELPCPVCVCDTIYSPTCATDDECMLISHHPYRRCVYGRCADCRADSDCGWGACLPPGVCFDMQPHPEALFGAWLIGWAGGLDHFSYFRFEPDGVLRRGRYQPEGPWADDIPAALPCWPDEPWPSPLVGTWEPEITASGFLVVRLSLNLPCDPGAGWTTRYLVNLAADGRSADFQHVDGQQHYQAVQVPMDRCTPDFADCQTPSYP